MKKEHLIYALFALFVWFSRDHIPPQLQFWKMNDTVITVQNNSGQDLSNVTVVVWSVPHSLGTISKGGVKTVKASRVRDTTDVVIKFKYGSEAVERLVGTLDEDSKYKMNIQVLFAGVVTAQIGATAESSDDKSK